VSVTSSPIDWYAARAAGVLAYLMLTLAVLLGLTLAGRLRLPGWPAFAVTDVHRFAGLLVGVFVSIHVATIALDSYTPFSLTQLVVPLSAGYRPLWTALGIVAVELLAAVALTNALRARIPYRWWRRVHVANLGVWAAATAHGIGAGTDTRSGWMAALYVVSVASVLAALAWRLGRARVSPLALTGLASAAGAIGVAAVVMLVGAAAPGTRTGAVRAAGLGGFSDRFSGSLSRRLGPGGELVSVLGHGSGSDAVTLRIDLVSGQGAGEASSLQLEDITTGTVCTGTVTTIDDAGFSGDCSLAGGASRSVSASWQLDADSLSGRLELTV
jgi:sulfoxide reductase heme-binding subunit YedZ